VADVQQWGRRESLIWPPRGFLYTLGALFIALVFTGLFVWLRFEFGLRSLERYYLPYYLRTETIGTLHPVGVYRLIFVSGAKSRTRPALEADLRAGVTPQPDGPPLPLTLSDDARKQGFRSLFREAPRRYANKPLHDWIARWIYGGQPVWRFFLGPLLWGIPVFGILLPLSIPRDIRRLKDLRYGRRLKGPVLVSPRGFNKTIEGEGIGITTGHIRRTQLRLPRTAENKHFLAVGDTGSGKTSIIRQMLVQVEERGECAIIYDPACEFVKQFYDEHRGDIVLNPLDARMPYWSPSAELRRRAEAKAIAVSMFQPEGITNKFFVEAPQKIFAHLLTFLPTPDELVTWMSNEEEIDKRVRRTEYWALIDKRAPHQRTGVLGSLNMCADSFRLLPRQEETTTTWTATKWAEERRGWIFITSRPTLREALRPLISLWIDLLVLRLLNEPDPGQKPVWFVIDELASLQRLPQLHTAITENRKSQNPVVLGFQGRSQMEARYGEDAEAMLSQPATKIFLRTSEPRAAKWVSEAIGEVEIERLRETHYDGSRAGRNFALDRQVEPLVLPSEISGLPDLRAFLKYGNHVARFSFPFVEIEEKHPAFIERNMDDLIVPPVVTEPETGEAEAEVFASQEPNGRLGLQVE
jgi:Type IV secretion-system coupling protein DNA-binding domain